MALYKVHDLVVWWCTPVEIASALARLARMKQLDAGDYPKARKLAQTLADSWSVVQPSDALRAYAIEFVDRFRLRAADSLQLAASLEWCEHTPLGSAPSSNGARYNFSELAGRLQWKGDAVREQRMLRDEW